MKEYGAIIIDDERHVRDALTIMLEENCPEIYLCGTAASAEEGRNLLNKQVVDFIFLDISMPKEDGFAFLKSIPGDKYATISYRTNRYSVSDKLVGSFVDVKIYSSKLEVFYDNRFVASHERVYGKHQ